MKGKNEISLIFYWLFLSFHTNITLFLLQSTKEKLNAVFYALFHPLTKNRDFQT